MTGTTDETLRPGQKLTVPVSGISRTGVYVRTDIGVQGFIRLDVRQRTRSACWLKLACPSCRI